jgi:hypothetical protein
MSAYAIPSSTWELVSTRRAGMGRTNVKRVRSRAVDRAVLVLREVAHELECVTQNCATQVSWADARMRRLRN